MVSHKPDYQFGLVVMVFLLREGFVYRILVALRHLRYIQHYNLALKMRSLNYRVPRKPTRISNRALVIVLFLAIGTVTTLSRFGVEPNPGPV